MSGNQLDCGLRGLFLFGSPETADLVLLAVAWQGEMRLCLCRNAEIQVGVGSRGQGVRRAE